MRRKCNGRFGAEDGYILLYVMVIVVTLCILAASICTSAVRNLKVQQHSVEHMEFVYEAEGIGERFVSEVVRLAKEDRRVVEDSEGGVAASLAEGEITENEAQMNAIFRDAVLAAEVNALADRELVGDVMNDPLESLTIAFDEETNLGTCEMDLRVVAGDSAVEAKIQWKMDVVAETLADGSGDCYRINRIEYTYLDYTVETVEIVEIDGGEPEEGGTE